MRNKIIETTPFGSVGIIWTEYNDNPKIIRVLLSKPGLSAEDQVSQLYQSPKASSCAEIDAVVVAIKGLLEGDDIEIPLDVVSLEECSTFQKSVLQAEHRIARGSVSTYRLLAEHVGKPNGARAVGNALANNPFPLIVPCHRAIRSDYHLGGYQGGVEMKRKLLWMEGVLFDDVGRVVCEQFYYEMIISNKGIQPNR